VHVKAVDRARRPRGLGRLACLCLERLQRPERAPEPGLRRTPVAQEDREGPGAVRVPDQGEAEILALGVALVLEQLDLHPLRALQAPGGGDDAAREERLQGALRCQLRHERRLLRLVGLRILLGKDDDLLRAQAVLQRVPRGARLAVRGPGAARPGPVETAGLRPGAHAEESRAGRGATDAVHGEGPCWDHEGWKRDEPGGAPRTGSLADDRNKYNPQARRGGPEVARRARTTAPTLLSRLTLHHPRRVRVRIPCPRRGGQAAAPRDPKASVSSRSGRSGAARRPAARTKPQAGRPSPPCVVGDAFLRRRRRLPASAGGAPGAAGS
jgi:hypothetical protein